MNILKVKELYKQYPQFTLDHVSFSLEEGKITGFIGRNGAGKSTTLKCLLNLCRPDGGEIEFFGKSFAENEFEIKKKIGFVTGGVSFFPMKKLSTISKTTKAFYGSDWDDAAYRNYMEMFRLDERKTPAQLSEGMKVKYALTLALSHNASLLILDEPTSGLDPVSRDDLLDVFLTLCDRGTTILFSTHITSDLDKCADNILYIKEGRILAQDALNAFTDAYRAAEFSEAQKDRLDPSKLIGCKRSKNGFTAIARANDLPCGDVDFVKTDLETIMIHLEK